MEIEDTMKLSVAEYLAEHSGKKVDHPLNHSQSHRRRQERGLKTFAVTATPDDIDTFRQCAIDLNITQVKLFSIIAKLIREGRI